MPMATNTISSVADIPLPIEVPVHADLGAQHRQPARFERTMSLGIPTDLRNDARSNGPKRALLVRLFFASVVVAIALMFFIPAVSHAADVINVNKADMTALQTLPGIGEKRAKAIMSYRKKNGGFGAKSDLLNVPGIGEKVLKKISSRISTSGGVSKVKSDKSKDTKKPASKDAKKDTKKSDSKKAKSAKSDDSKSKTKDSKKSDSKKSSKKDSGKDKKKKSKSSDSKKKKKSKSSDKKKKKKSS